MPPVDITMGSRLVYKNMFTLSMTLTESGSDLGIVDQMEQ